MFKKLFHKDEQITYLITYIGGFSESNHPIHRWDGWEVVKCSKKKDVNEVIEDVQKKVSAGAYGFFSLKNVSVIK